MLSSEGATLGVWISYGEGKFNLLMSEENYNIVAKYGYRSTLLIQMDRITIRPWWKVTPLEDICDDAT
jgi:hypothetical protein